MTVGARRRALIVQICRHQSRLPVVRMQDVGQIPMTSPCAEHHGNARQRGETKCVVCPVMTARPAIRIAIARIEVRCIDHEQIQARRPCHNDACLAAEQIVEMRDHRRHFPAHAAPADNLESANAL